jgi:hypothetical protein
VRFTWYVSMNTEGLETSSQEASTAAAAFPLAAGARCLTWARDVQVRRLFFRTCKLQGGDTNMARHDFVVFGATGFTG